MAEFIAQLPQIVAQQNNVLFTDTLIEPCPCVTHRDGSGLFTLHGGHRYLLTFGANVSAAVAGAQSILAFSINGEMVPASEMIDTSTAANELNNVSRSIYIVVPKCCCFNVAIKNIGDQAASVQNANLIIIRED